QARAVEKARAAALAAAQEKKIEALEKAAAAKTEPAAEKEPAAAKTAPAPAPASSATKQRDPIGYITNTKQQNASLSAKQKLNIVIATIAIGLLLAAFSGFAVPFTLGLGVAAALASGLLYSNDEKSNKVNEVNNNYNSNNSYQSVAASRTKEHKKFTDKISKSKNNEENYNLKF
ncbi:MAG: hypothetical protein ACO2XZ_03980, partial [Rickettsiales bacterium]